MSTSRKPIGLKSDAILIGIAGLLLIGIFWFVTSNSQQVLRRSPAGLDGLERWLITADGPELRSFTGGWTTDPAKIEELLMQMAEYDQRSSIVRQKINIAPTLIILPKWRSGMRLTGLAHPALLIPSASTQKSLQAVLRRPSPKVSFISEPFRDFEVQSAKAKGKTARLYVPQVFTDKSCEPLIGTAQAIVLGRCTLKNAPNDSVLVLSDPDLVNNHGLRLGDNAHIMRDILLAEASKKAIRIDYSTRIWLYKQDQGVTRERTWNDLLQFFAYPFSLLWASAGLLMALVLWRAGVRYGPLLTSTGGIGASKQIANSARARLMRLTGQDGALLRDYTDTRLAALAAQKLGPTAATDPRIALKLVRRKRPDLADRLDKVLSDIKALPAHLPAASAISYVETFEHIMEQLDHDT